jgi:MFS family permease
VLQQVQRQANANPTAASINRLGIVQARTGRISDAKASYERAAGMGFVPAMTQIGFATGMLLLAPLGDKLDRRQLIIWQAVGVCAALLIAALAPSLMVLIGASFLLGTFATLAQQAGPFAAEIAHPSRRGQAVGTVMSGLLAGILLARTASGFIGQYLGWRLVFGTAIVAMIVLMVIVRYGLPASRPASTLTYGRLMASLWQLAVELRGLREAALIGASLFAAFSLFWSTLALLLADAPLHLGPRDAGLFGIVGLHGNDFIGLECALLGWFSWFLPRSSMLAPVVQ